LGVSASAGANEPPEGVEAAPPDSQVATVETEAPPGPPEHEPGARTGPEAEPAPLADAPEEPEWFGGKPYLEWSRLTGDWAGGRTWLEERGVTFEATHTLDWTSVLSGGLANRASTRTIFDANATFDLEKLVSLPGASVYLDFYSTDMRGGSRDVGDFMGISSIESGENLDIIGELWYQQWLLDKHLRLKFGKIEGTEEFAFVEASEDFLNTGAGFLYTITGFPAYPDPATGVLAFGYPTDWLYIGGGVFDGALLDGIPTGTRGPKTFFSDDDSSSWFTIGEVGLTWKELAGMGAGRVFCGVSHHSATFVRFDGTDQHGTTDFYVMGEQQLIASGASTEDAPRGLFGWVQYGRADGDVSEIEDQAGVGLVLRGICSARPDDAAGAYFGWAGLSGDPNAGFAEDEYVVELVYRVQVTPAVIVRPDLQFIFNPSGDPGIDDAVVGGLRLEIAF
jgi:porin